MPFQICGYRPLYNIRPRLLKNAWLWIQSLCLVIIRNAVHSMPPGIRGLHQGLIQRFVMGAVAPNASPGFDFISGPSNLHFHTGSLGKREHRGLHEYSIFGLACSRGSEAPGPHGRSEDCLCSYIAHSNARSCSEGHGPRAAGIDLKQCTPGFLSTIN